MSPTRLDEEARGLLRQIVQRQAYRQVLAADIRGAGLKFLPELEEKQRFAADLSFSLRVVREVERLYAELDGGALSAMVRTRIARLPFPESRLELACCLALTGRAELAAAKSYLECVHKGQAAIAHTLLEADRTGDRHEEELFVEYCARSTHRPAAQQYWNRWLVISLLALGRPGTARDRRAVQLGLRNLHAADVVRGFLDDVETLRVQCGLAMPALDGLGVELPEDLRGRFSVAAQHT